MIADNVRRALETEGPVLDSDMPAILSAVGWRRLMAVGIDQAGYSTARALAGDPAPRRIVTTLVPIQGPGEPILVEAFAGSIPQRYAELGIREARLPPDRLRDALAAGLAELAASPAAAATVAALVRSLHPLMTADPAYDVSYSDPEVPFSVFVGIHDAPVKHEGLRVAEALVHEAMHLQLSLAEDVVPLVAGEEERWSSPWQRRPRPAQGVLHGLYVFRAVEELLCAVPASADPSRTEYLRRRLEAIDAETAEAAAVAASGELTPTGRALARRLASRAH
ncbi:aKG-HExxH-type peptide beta-hydroxylase [Sphingomonas bacterium]|uniref:aKG-HExxH-type peptide beta-hydroxylase n=1 Tax=Sphingomonas bacterium TaxID=1895847 RepID=UPI0015768059|nr:HEXXH motif-containing putative peptide modification protein [Sphingomonas bacterium]